MRIVCNELDYWGAFVPSAGSPGLPQGAFQLMSQDTPRAFLGIDAAAPKPNIVKYTAYMQANAGWSHADALAWLTKTAS
ncbi:MAG: hypothetical protein HQK81_02465 [Desulfovibrionaceae bacterium]|nr:hypothetical protein [Desulfovibrionaceae bacterium]MBF0512909.1 hypothetical protein [Desulfovibrionaceae bacterium]